MRIVYLSLAFLISLYSLNAEITKANDMDIIFDDLSAADSKTLVIFDVDMVLVQPSDPAFQMANMKKHGSISKKIMKEVPADKQMLFLSLMTASSDPVLIDSRIPQFIEKLGKKDIPMMALTANLTGALGLVPSMEQLRVTSLDALGINFSKLCPFSEKLVFTELASYRGNYSTFLSGILFVNGTSVSKGEAFLAFLEKTQLNPEKIVFIDDREDNLVSLETALRTLKTPIEFQGFHYAGALSFPSEQISEEEFEAKWRKLAIMASELTF